MQHPDMTRAFHQLRDEARFNNRAQDRNIIIVISAIAGGGKSSNPAEMTRDALMGQFTYLRWLADNYLLWMRQGYLAQFAQIKPDSDLILDWQESAEASANAIVVALSKAGLA